MNNFLMAGIITWIYMGIMTLGIYSAISKSEDNEKNIMHISKDIERIDNCMLPFVKQLYEINCEDISEIRKEVAELSKMMVDAEPVRHGKWVYKGTLYYSDNNTHNTWSCSACGCSEFALSRYCPNCGARMDEE